MLHNATLFLAVVVERNARRCALVFPPPPSGETVKRLSQRDLWRLTVSPVRWYAEQMFGLWRVRRRATPSRRGGNNALKSDNTAKRFVAPLPPRRERERIGAKGAEARDGDGSPVGRNTKGKRGQGRRQSRR